MHQLKICFVPGLLEGLFSAGSGIASQCISSRFVFVPRNARIFFFVFSFVFLPGMELPLNASAQDLVSGPGVSEGFLTQKHVFVCSYLVQSCLVQSK